MEDDTQQRYLAAKRTVDDRALNRPVLDALTPELGSAGHIVEVGAGIGTMLQRLVEWDRLRVTDDVTYTLVDVDRQSLATATRRLPAWARDRGWGVASDGTADRTPTGSGDGYEPIETIHLDTGRGTLTVRAVPADAVAFLATGEPDVVIGCAFLDLLREPAVDDLFSRLPTGCVCYFPITFDGGTVFEPPASPGFDELVTERYHEDMRRRADPGDPHAGRRLLSRAARDHELLAAGASDWVVAPGLDGAAPDAYPGDEAFFLRHIVRTVHGALADDPAVDDAAVDAWVERRLDDIDAGRLVYLAHQLDVLLRVGRD